MASSGGASRPSDVAIRHILDRVTLHSTSMKNYPSVFNVVELVMRVSGYHLDAQSFVSYSFEDEFSTPKANIHETHCILSALELRALGVR